MLIMKNKILKNFTYNGLGFPIKLHNVEMAMIEGELHPKIDVKEISESAIKSLVRQENRLTGNQIKFIRTYFSMSLREFSKVVNESHMAVKKWEDFGNKPTNMDLNIEILLRLHIHNQVAAVKTNKDKIEFYDQYTALTTLFSEQQDVR